jgi:hypothetical protein
MTAAAHLAHMRGVLARTAPVTHNHSDTSQPTPGCPACALPRPTEHDHRRGITSCPACNPHRAWCGLHDCPTCPPQPEQRHAHQ